ncbi:MAG: diversity-generating retroelement protein Avd [Candidatus Cloacimonadota bacterium]|nr:diversity-generating retroelement protein Avd [Candidatus Cloacimonadota bacterium]
MNEVKILPALYDLIVWFSPKLSNYPKKYKYTLGDRILSIKLDILENIIDAKYSGKKKSYFLRKANLQLEKLRFLIRLSKDLQCISIKQYEQTAKRINEIGKMVGGWEKHSKMRNK